MTPVGPSCAGPSQLKIRSIICTLRIRNTQDGSPDRSGARLESSANNNDRIPAAVDVADKQQHRWKPSSSEFRVVTSVKPRTINLELDQRCEPPISPYAFAFLLHWSSV